MSHDILIFLLVSLMTFSSFILSSSDPEMSIGWLISALDDAWLAALVEEAGEQVRVTGAPLPTPFSGSASGTKGKWSLYYIKTKIKLTVSFQYSMSCTMLAWLDKCSKWLYCFDCSLLGFSAYFNSSIRERGQGLFRGCRWWTSTFLIGHD